MSEIQGLSERLVVLRRKKGLTQDELAHELGLSKSGVSKFENGKSNPLPENLVKLSHLLEVSVDYLLTGREFDIDHLKPKAQYPSQNRLNNYVLDYRVTKLEATDLTEEIEEMLRHSVEDERPTKRAHINPHLRVLTVQVGSDNDENIAFVSQSAATSYARGGRMEQKFIRELPSFRLPSPAYRNGSFRCFQVSGNSMQPTLHDGDWLICRFIENWPHDIQNNQVYVVVSEREVLINRVLTKLNERGLLMLQCDNHSFDGEIISWNEVREVWIGVARLTQDLTNPQLDIPLELAHQQASIAELFQRLEQLEAKNTPTSPA